MMEIERRYFDLIEIRNIDNNSEQKKMVGYAAIFNVETDIAGLFREKIAPGAFKNSINNDDIRALINHNPNFVLGRKNKKTNTLELNEDEKGLAVTIYPPDTQYARDLAVSIERGDITQMSFGFVVNKETWETKDDGIDIRTLESVQLWDVSPVTFPAYAQTEIAVRSHTAYRKSIEYNKVPDKSHDYIWHNDIQRRRLQLKSQLGGIK